MDMTNKKKGVPHLHIHDDTGNFDPEEIRIFGRHIFDLNEVQCIAGAMAFQARSLQISVQRGDKTVEPILKATMMVIFKMIAIVEHHKELKDKIEDILKSQGIEVMMVDGTEVMKQTEDIIKNAMKGPSNDQKPISG